MLLVAEVVASPAVNMMAFLWCRVLKMEGDLGEEDLLGGTTAKVDGMAGVEGMVETRVVSESSP